MPTGNETDLPWILTIPTPEEREALLDRYAGWSRDRYEQNCRYLDRDLPDGTRGSWKMGHLDPSLANQSSIAYYGYGGFWDLLAYDMPMGYAALTVPRESCFWDRGTTPTGLAAKRKKPWRWLDYHLKHVDNGIMREPPVTFSTSHPEKPLRWYGADTFPPPGVIHRTFFVSPDPTAPLTGRLEAGPTDDPHGSLEFTVDYDTTSGLESRQWGYALGLYLNIERLEKIAGSDTHHCDGAVGAGFGDHRSPGA